jgi:V8-like Glu-specific endopeptidase
MLAAVVCAALSPSVARAAVNPGLPPSVHTVSREESDAADDYWTPDRMTAAVADTPDGSMEAAGVRARHFRGLGSVGALFFRDGSGDHFCTASVIHSWHANLLITAGHCLYGAGGYRSRVVFVPRYSDGERPLGSWRIRTMAVDRRWVASSDQDLDFGFATVRPNHGRNIEQIVHGNRLASDQGFHNWVHVVGYPRADRDPADTAIYCRNWTTKAARFQVRFDCAGYASGTSGSPWMTRFDWRSGTGDVIGVIGGYHSGGWSPSVSYTSYFDHDIRHLYQTALNLP